MVLILMALSLMLGIRIERYQSGVGFQHFEQAVQAPLITSPESITDAVKTVQTEEVAPAAALHSKPAPEPPAVAAKEEVKPEAPPQISPQVVSAVVPVKAEDVKAEEGKAEPAKVVEKKDLPAPPAPEQKQAAATVEKGHFAIQVTSSQDKNMATAQMSTLKDKGFPSFIEEIDIENKGRFYRVLVGPYQTEAEATEVLSRLKKDSRFAGGYVRFLP